MTRRTTPAAASKRFGPGRTASRALAVGAQPFLLRLGAGSLDAALREDEGLARGVYMYRGRIVKAETAEALGVPHVPLSEALASEGG